VTSKTEREIFTRVATSLLLLATLSLVPVTAIANVLIAVIIDDLGDSLGKGRRALALPGEVTLAVLPHTRWGQSLANEARQRQREVILHLPMANLANMPLGPKPLTHELTRLEFRDRLIDALAKVPGARGINNHTGSALTQEPRAMAWLMHELREHGLYFIDSRTTHKSVANRVAGEHAVLASERDVFLDNERTFDAIDRQFEKLIGIARGRGAAIGIGHPHPETLEYLEMRLPKLAIEEVRLVPTSHLIAYQSIARSQLVRMKAPLLPATLASVAPL